VDIAQCAMGMQHTGSVTIDGRGKLPHVPNGYNVPIDFEATLVYPDGTVMEIRDTGRAGIMFEGDQERLFVNRGVLVGKPIEQLQDNPLPETDHQRYAYDDLRLAKKVADEEFELAGNYRPIANHVANSWDALNTDLTNVR
jgi:hypothetical protein